jgi:alpha-1,3/alpha-1,6-mannosyltransferase
VRGNTLIPPSLLGRFAILCAILRQLHLILHIVLLTSELRDLAPDAFFVDQLSAGLPLLKALAPPAAPIFFYCHFPDLLLAQGRARLWKRLYRLPFDALEQWSMASADAVAVNSEFTKSIVTQTWPTLAAKTHLHVVHPCIDTTPLVTTATTTIEPHPRKPHGILLSINRFERKKNLSLALHAFAALPPSRRKRAKLLLAGGYDPRVAENVAHHAELAALADDLGLRNATTKTLVSALNVPDDVEVLFLLSVPAVLKEMLLRSARLLVYTPGEENFGIVPREAMLRGVPVLAADSGGPRETVVEGVTGWLRDAGRAEEWSEVMGRVLNDLGEGEWERMGRAGVERVKGRFAEAQMAERLEGILGGMERTSPGLGVSVLVAGVVAVVGVLLGVGVLAVRIAR